MSAAVTDMHTARTVRQMQAEAHMETVYVSCADTAKLVRAALKAAFPGVKFSVTSKSYSMGASMRVGWVDGPTVAEVETITGPYRGKGPMDITDYSPDVYHVVDGKRINYGSDYIFCERRYSVEFAQRVADDVCAEWGMEWITVTPNSYNGAASWSEANDIDAGADDNGWRTYDLADRISHALSRRPYTPPAEG